MISRCSKYIEEIGRRGKYVYKVRKSEIYCKLQIY